jgi:hypothetical protein
MVKVKAKRCDGYYLNNPQEEVKKPDAMRSTKCCKCYSKSEIDAHVCSKCATNPRCNRCNTRQGEFVMQLCEECHNKHYTSDSLGEFHYENQPCVLCGIKCCGSFTGAKLCPWCAEPFNG